MDITTTIFGGVLIAAGAALLAKGIYNFVSAKRLASSARWKKTDALITGDYSFTERGMPYATSFKSRSNPVTYTQRKIVYVADGESYEKTAFIPEEEGTVPIYYDTKNPSHFYTEEEWLVRFKDRRSGKSLAFWIVMAAIASAVGAAMLYSGLQSSDIKTVLTDAEMAQLLQKGRTK